MNIMKKIFGVLKKDKLEIEISEPFICIEGTTLTLTEGKVYQGFINKDGTQVDILDDRNVVDNYTMLRFKPLNR